MNFPGRRALMSTNLGYRAAMCWKWGLGNRELPSVRPMNTVLKTEQEVQAAVAEAKRLSLPPFTDDPKNWDTLGALYEVITRTPKDGFILDAGAEIYSRILPWLYIYGYRNLFGNNLVFEKAQHYGPICYEPGDITATRFGKAHFDAITCLSVIEHGVDLEAYFKEMARILKPGGILVTSTDYFEQSTDTQGKVAYGGQIRIFAKDDMLRGFATAEKHGLKLTTPVDLISKDRVVHWKQYDLRYTFLVFAMIRQ